MPDPRAWLRSLVDDENDPIRKILGEGQRLAAGIDQRLPPAVAASYRGGINMALDLDPVVGPARAAGRTRQTVEDVQQGRMKVSEAITSPLRHLNTQGRETGTVVREPISAAIARTTGIDSQAQPLGTGSFERLKAAAEAESDPLKRVLARAGLGGLDLATNVTTYIPSAKAGQGANLATKALTTGYNLTIGGFTGAGVSPAKAALQAAVMGAGAGAGEETASQLMKGNEVAKAIGALVGGGAAVTGGGLLPGKVGQAFRPAGVTGGAARKTGVPDLLYHGTKAEFPAFDVARFGSHKDAGIVGRGVYATETEDVARLYGPHVLVVRPAVKRPYLWPDDAGNVRTESLGVAPLPADIRTDVLRRYHSMPSVAQDAPVTNTPKGWGVAETGTNALDETRLSQAVTDTLKALGYDSVIYQNPYAKRPQREFVIFDPSAARIELTPTLGTGARGITEGGARGVGRVDDARLKALDARLKAPESGAATTAFGADPNRTYEFRYRVVSLDDLVPSQTDTFAPNPRYPRELQPRDRTRVASQEQVMRIADQPNIDAFLTDTRQLDSGPMIVGADNAVESGNGRILALRRMREQNPQAFDAYQQALRRQAEEYGIDPTVVDRLSDPILVRERVTRVDRVAFAEEANQARGLVLAASVQTRGDVRRVPVDLLATMQVGESQTLEQALTSPINRVLVQRFLAEIPQTERAALVDAGGSLNRAGLDRLRTALFTWVYPGEAGDRLTRALSESVDPTAKNIQSALLQSLPDVARAEAQIRQGARDDALSIVDDISRAVDMLTRLRENGMRVGEYLDQASMFERELTPFQESLLRYLDQNAMRSPKRLRELLKGYAAAVEEQPPPNQIGMFGEVARPTKGQILDSLVTRQGPEEGVFAAAEAVSPAASTGGQAVPLSGAVQPSILPTGPTPAQSTLASGVRQGVQGPTPTIPQQPYLSQTPLAPVPPVLAPGAGARQAPFPPTTGGPLTPAQQVAQTMQTVQPPRVPPRPPRPPKGGNQFQPPLPPSSFTGKAQEAAQWLAESRVRLQRNLQRIQEPAASVKGETPIGLVERMRNAVYGGSHEAGAQGQIARDLGRIVDEEVANGGIREDAVRQGELAALLSAARGQTGRTGRAVGDVLNEHHTSVPVILEEIPTGFTPQATAQNMGGFVLSPRAQEALAVLRQIQDEQLTLEKAFNAAPGSVRENYVRHAWKDAAPPANVQPSPSIARRLGAKQAHQKQRVHDNIIDGILAGYEPATRDIGFLVEARVQAGLTASAHQQVIAALKKRTDWFHLGKDAPDTNWVVLDNAQLRRMIPSLDRAGARDVLQNFRRGVTTEGEALRHLTDDVDLIVMTPWVRQDVAKALETYFGRSALEDQKAMKVVSGIFNAARELRLGLDLAMTGRLSPIAFAQAVAADPLHPWRAASVVIRAYDDALRGGGFEQLARDPKALEAMYWLHQHPRGVENPILGYKAGEGPLVRAAKAYNEWANQRGGIPGVFAKGTARPFLLGEKLETWQFEKFVPALQIHLFNHLYDSLSQGAYRNMNQDQLKALVGKRVGVLLGNPDLLAKGHTPNRRFIERIALLSPSWTYGILDTVGGTFKGGPEGMLARRFWVATAATMLSTSVGLSLAFSNDYSPEHIARLLDPRSEDSIINPLGRNFMGIELPGGARMQIWGPIKPITQALLAPVAAGIGKANETALKQAQADFLSAAVTVGIEGAKAALGQATGLSDGVYNTIPQWIIGRRSIPVGLAADIMGNRDFRGRAIRTADSNVEQAGQALAYAALSLPPGVAQSALDTDRAALPEGIQTPGTYALRGGLGFLGINANPPSQDPAVIKEKARGMLAQYGINGGLDPVGRYRAERGKLPLDVRQKFEADNPDVMAHIAKKRTERIDAIPQALGREAVQLYQGERQRAATDRNAAIQDALAKLRRGEINGNEFRRANEAAWDSYIGGTERLAKSILNVNSLDEANAKVKATLGSDNDQGELGALWEQYNSIRPAVGDISSAGLEASLDERQRFVDELPADIRERFLAFRRDRAREIGGEQYGDDYAAYFDAQQIMAQRARMPLYLGMTLEQSRQVAKALQRADDRLKFGVFGPITTGMREAAILTDPATPGDIRGLAWYAAKGKLNNPMRAMFLRQPQHAKAAAFYSDLVYEDVQQLIARAE